MVTIHLEVLQAHSFQQRWNCEMSRAGCLLCSPGCVLAGRGGKKSRLKTETPEILMTDQQQKGMQGLQHRTAEQALGVIFSSPASLLKAVSDIFLWFWASLNLYKQLPPPGWGAVVRIQESCHTRQQKPHTGDAAGLPSFTGKIVHTFIVDSNHNSALSPLFCLYFSWSKVEPLHMFLLCLARTDLLCSLLTQPEYQSWVLMTMWCYSRKKIPGTFLL